MPFENLIDQKAILRRRDLSSTEKLVALVALSFRNASSGRCDPPVESDDPSADTICGLSGFSRPCVNKALASLEAKGIIKRTARSARPSQIDFTLNTRNDVTRNEVTRNEVTPYPKPGYGLPVTTLPQTDKYREEQITSVAPACPTVDDIPADVFGPDPDISNPPVLAPVADKEKKPKRATETRGKRLDVTELTPEWIAACKKIQPTVDPQKVFESFCDYWNSVPDSRGRYKDWLCVWRNWLRRMRRDEVERMSAGAGSDAQKAQPYFSAQPHPTSQLLQAGAWFRKKTAPAMAANAVEDAHEAEMYEVLRREAGWK
jgi:hypothetical protein